METLKRAAELTQAGHGQIVAAVAEHGVGKSRLFVEFKAKIQSGWMVLEAFSVSHGKASAYLPVLDLLHSYFKITSDDDARSRREKVAGKITVLDRSLEDALPYLFAVLGIVEGEDALAQMDGQVKKRRTLDAIKRILLRESLNQPLIVMFEDPHWTASEQFTLRSFELSRRRGVSWEKSWLAISALCTTAVFRANVSRASELAIQALAIAEQHENAELTAWSLCLLAVSQIFAGRFESAENNYDRSIAMFETMQRR